VKAFQYARVQLAAYIVTFAWSLVVLVAGLKMDGLLTKALNALPLVLVLSFAAFDTYIWRQKQMRRLVQHPVLNGTWKGSLVSIREGADGSDTEYEPIPIFIVIWQTYLTISISLISAESRSRSIAAVLEKNSYQRLWLSSQLKAQVGVEIASVLHRDVNIKVQANVGVVRIRALGIDDVRPPS